MAAVQTTSLAPAPRQRARFEALRRKLFADMGWAVARWRLAWVIPFNVAVLAVLALRGMPPGRVAIQIAAFVGSMVVFKFRIHRAIAGHQEAAPTALIAGSALYFLGLINTGGLASPLVATGIPMLMSASMQPIAPRARNAAYAFFIAGAVVVAAFAHSRFGLLPEPLAAVGGYSSTEYVVIAMGALIFTVVAVALMGQGITGVYERVAFELAERREEICNESEDRTRALEGIAARLAHEVKNPLAAIKGLSTHMSRNAEDPKVAERLAIVAAEADRLQAIVEGFLSFSRGLEDLQLAPVVPYALARELVVLLETRAADVGVNLEVKGSEELVLNADGRKLRQSLLNLVLNAMQASPAGETVTIEIAKCCGGSACVKVIDRGHGMTPEVLDRIQRPYFTTREGGTGLGVAIARGLIEQHGGHLHFDSRPGKGTTVTIDLPACAKKAAAARELPKPARVAEA
jgi:signal transduction histidine kinase